jgi:uncharacterized protein YjbI with pentapeptide repeats
VTAIHTNLTPFFWGPKATSRRGRQVEMALCVRGVFRLAPGRPLEPIEDKIAQGFMSGDTWAPTDPEQKGPLAHTSDFAEWKPLADVLLRGTAYPPKGADVTCEVGFSVGEWSKRLRVVGPRTWKPGLLFGGTASDPEPFTKMPLTWENAYGGPGYAANPVGKGYQSMELPTVEDLRHPVTKVGAKGVAPGTFLPVSPLWPPRAGKMGANYGKDWEAKRAPFVSEDFDWTFHNAAPLDQQLPKYLRGDEALTFEHLHPDAPRWETRLPGLRLRALVKDDQGAVRDLVLPLDTLLADTDAGRLFLVWRGHVPVRELDLTDVKVVLIASEPLAEPPRPHEHYLRLLEEYEADPVGLKKKFPPGFLEVATAIDAFEKAEMNGAPLPDLKKVAETLPAGCPIPPWFLAAVAGDKDPLGLAAKLPDPTSDDPLRLREKVPQLAGLDPNKLAAALKQPGKSPDAAAASLEAAAKDLPPDLAKPLKEAAAKLREAGARLKEAAAKDERAGAGIAAAMAKGPDATPPPSPSPGDALKGVPGKLAAAAEKLPADQPEAKVKLLGAAAQAGEAPSLDDAVARCLAQLDQVQLPALPAIPDVEAQLAAQKADLVAQEAALRKQGVDHPLLGLFALGHRLIDKAPRPGDVVPDLDAIPAAMNRAKDGLLGAGISLAALGPLVRLTGRVEALLAKLPPRRPAPARRDHAYEDLRREDLRVRDLRGKSLARAKLQQANLAGGQLAQADLTEADLTRADLSRADLTGATACKVVLKQADLRGANLSGADLSGADLSEADLTGASLAGANLEGAVLQDAKLPGADLTRANLTDAQLAGADLTRARLVEARLEQVKGEKVKLEGADLTGANLRFANLAKPDLRGAKLVGADLSITQLSKARGDDLDLSGARLDMGRFVDSRLRGAKLVGARSSMGALTGCDLTGADLRRVTFEKVDFAQAVLDQADLREASLEVCMMRDVRATGARFDGANLAGVAVTGASALLGCTFLLVRGRRAIFFGADLTGSDFSHAQLGSAYFQAARGAEVNFFAADLKGASFRKADLRRTRFVRANLCGADLNESRLLDMQFTGANLYDAKFIEAKLAGCDWLEANLVMARFDRAQGAPA